MLVVRVSTWDQDRDSRDQTLDKVRHHERQTTEATSSLGLLNEEDVVDADRRDAHRHAASRFNPVSLLKATARAARLAAPVRAQHGLLMVL